MPQARSLSLARMSLRSIQSSARLAEDRLDRGPKAGSKNLPGSSACGLMHKEVVGELGACVIHQVRIVESEGRSRKPKYDFKRLIRSTFFN